MARLIDFFLRPIALPKKSFMLSSSSRRALTFVLCLHVYIICTRAFGVERRVSVLRILLCVPLTKDFVNTLEYKKTDRYADREALPLETSI